MLIRHAAGPPAQQVHLGNAQQHPVEKIQQDRRGHLTIEDALLLPLTLVLVGPALAQEQEPEEEQEEEPPPSPPSSLLPLLFSSSISILPLSYLCLLRKSH